MQYSGNEWKGYCKGWSSLNFVNKIMDLFGTIDN
jgi:hypothetical protein